MSFQGMRWASELRDPKDKTKYLSPTIQTIAYRLGDFHNHSSGKCFMKMETLAKRSGCTIRAVQQSLQVLIAMGAIERRAETGPTGKFRRWHYKLNDPRCPVDPLFATELGANVVRPTKVEVTELGANHIHQEGEPYSPLEGEPYSPLREPGKKEEPGELKLREPVAVAPDSRKLFFDDLRLEGIFLELTERAGLPEELARDQWRKFGEYNAGKTAPLTKWVEWWTGRVERKALDLKEGATSGQQVGPSSQAPEVKVDPRQEKFWRDCQGKSHEEVAALAAAYRADMRANPREEGGSS